MLKKKDILIIIIIALAAVMVYAHFIEPYDIQVRSVSISDPALARAWGAIKIVQLSDLHITRTGRREQKILRLLADIKPDLIVITGDSAQWGCRPDEAIDFLKRLKAPLGVYGVLGDADLSSRRYHCLICHPQGDYRHQRTRPIFLQDKTVRIALENRGILTLAGIFPADSPVPGKHFLDQLQALEPPGEALLILGHFSLAWTDLCATTDRPLLWLAGDTHGGQIRLPAFVWSRLRLKPDSKHMAGLYQGPHPHQWLYVSRGLGTTRNFPFRLGVRPEITVFSFARPQEKEQ